MAPSASKKKTPRPNKPLKKPKTIIIGNWKMNGLQAAAKEVRQLHTKIKKAGRINCDVMICPPATLIGTLVGVVILRTLDNGLVLINVSSYNQQVGRGVVLLLAVGLDQLRLRLGQS